MILKQPMKNKGGLLVPSLLVQKLNQEEFFNKIFGYWVLKINEMLSTNPEQGKIIHQPKFWILHEMEVIV
jgi:hypothetical protein